jgi:hypothetical protein
VSREFGTERIRPVFVLAAFLYSFIAFFQLLQYLNYLDIRVFFVIIKYIGLKWSPALFSPASPMYLSSYLLVFLEAKVVVD